MQLLSLEPIILLPLIECAGKAFLYTIFQTLVIMNILANALHPSLLTLNSQILYFSCTTKIKEIN